MCELDEMYDIYVACFRNYIKHTFFASFHHRKVCSCLIILAKGESVGAMHNEW